MPLASRLGPFNVKTYGATGNGSTDDTSSIASAVSAIVSADTAIKTWSLPFTVWTTKVLTMGTAVNNFTGFIGIQFTVGPQNIVVTDLGRWIVSGNNQNHTLKLVLQSNGTDVAGGSTTLVISWTGGTWAGNQFIYTPLTAPLTLSANTAYYLVSNETSGGDQFLNNPNTVTTTGAMTLNGRVFNSAGYMATLDGTENVLLDMRYYLASTPLTLPTERAPYELYFPAGTYLCSTTPLGKANWGGATPNSVFSIPNVNITIRGDGKDLTTIIASNPTTLFDTYQSGVNPTAQNLIVQDMTIQYGTTPGQGFNQSSKAFAIVFAGNSCTCNRVRFLEWTQALRGPEGQATQCGLLVVDSCDFLYVYGVPYMADDDPTYGYPTQTILGGGTRTIVRSCNFDGQTNHGAWPANPGVAPQGMDGLIKTINQVRDILIRDCTVVNNREECIICEAQNIGGMTIWIENNYLGPSYKMRYPSSGTPFFAGISLFSTSGTVLGNILEGQSPPYVLGDAIATNNTVFIGNSVITP